MYMRLAVESPPKWQIVLCFAILVATIYVVQRIATRIYRVGILMYGKRPSLSAKCSDGCATRDVG